MNTTVRTAALEAKSAALRASAPAFSGSSIDVDEQAGILRGVALMNVGEAAGHGFLIDLKTLEQVRDLLNAAGDSGVKVRFRHPNIGDDGTVPDDLGDVIGVVKNGRIDGESLRGDVHLGDYAEVLPGLGDVRTYLIRRAKSNPASFGMSAVIGFDTEPVTNGAGEVVGLVARVSHLDAIDVVGRGAATPNGLLSQQQQAKQPQTPTATAEPTKAPPAAQPQQKKGLKIMDPKIKQYLSANHGLAADASEEDAQKLFDGLSADDQAKAKAAANLSAKPNEGEASRAQLRQTIITDEGDRLLAEEGRRVTQLQQLGKTLNVADHVVSMSIAAGDTVIDARKKFLAHLTEKAKPVSGAVSVGEDKKLSMLSQALPDAILLRAGRTSFYDADGRGRVKRDANGVPVKGRAHDMADRYAGLSVLDMYRQWLIGYGAPADEVHMMSRAALAECIGPRGLRRRFPQVAALAQSTSDFDNIILDAQNKTMRMGYVEAPRTWQLWAKRATAVDFKTVNRPQASEVPTLTQRKEGGEIKYVTITDSKETYQLQEYIGGVKLTRRTLINDDMNALADVPQKQGQAAARLEEDLAYFVLLNNAAMADTGALFNSTAVTTTGGHANLITSGGGAPTVTTVAATEKLIMLQKGPKNAAILNLEPKFLLCPVAIKTVSQQFVASNVDPSKSNQTPNPYNGKLQVVPNARFDNGVTVGTTTASGSSTIWYLMADYRDGQIDTVEVCFLADEPEPVLKQENDFDTDDVKYACRHVCAAAALDFRGMARNPGA